MTWATRNGPQLLRCNWLCEMNLGPVPAPQHNRYCSPEDLSGCQAFAGLQLSLLARRRIGLGALSRTPKSGYPQGLPIPPPRRRIRLILPHGHPPLARLPCLTIVPHQSDPPNLKEWRSIRTGKHRQRASRDCRYNQGAVAQSGGASFASRGTRLQIPSAPPIYVTWVSLYLAWMNNGRLSPSLTPLIVRSMCTGARGTCLMSCSRRCCTS